MVLDAGRVEWEAGDSLAGLQELCSFLIPSVIVLLVSFWIYNRNPPSVQPCLYNQMHGVRYPGKLIRAGPQLIEQLRTFYEILFHCHVYKNGPLSLFWAKCFQYSPLILIFGISFNIILTYMCTLLSCSLLEDLSPETCTNFSPRHACHIPTHVISDLTPSRNIWWEVQMKLLWHFCILLLHPLRPNIFLRTLLTTPTLRPSIFLRTLLTTLTLRDRKSVV
jgi:hypothetical protein